MHEEDIGVDVAPAGGAELSARISVGGRRNFVRTVATSAIPGGAMRCLVRFHGTKHSARMLAYVDPMTGHAVIRMGMITVGKDGKTHEEDEQIIWNSDAPVYSIK